ncbi:hypothetical protein HELRODRAFT_176433 [Helobdella robusta]|uniref:Uncharacterized protein n=1 Tax=Helobdella robusta TaxID=6412 RepID=T1FAI1_HELRO|nr:hypothetical protein HELRODRAFT_176433 [Helobdella robusta]ESO00121.1 hypothetical protein HELRODRAFT_176433 [Helobdella robusta]
MDATIITRDIRTIGGYSKQYEVQKVVKRSNNRHFDLVIKHVVMLSAGIYTCIDAGDNEQGQASLTIITVPRCFQMPKLFQCNYLIGGVYDLRTKWACKHDHDKVEEKNESPMKISWISLHGRSSITVFNVSTSAKYAKQINFCNLTISSKKEKLKYAGSFDSVDEGKKYPDFFHLLHPIQKVELNITDSFNLLVNQTIHCQTDSPIRVKYEIRIKQSGQRPVVISSNKTSISTPGVYDIVCQAKNSLNTDWLTHSVTGVKVVVFHNRTKCIDDSKVCTKSLTSVFLSGKFKMLNKVDHKLFCSKHSFIIKCVEHFLPCDRPLWMVNLMKAFQFYCKGKYKRAKMLEVSIDEKYPQLLPKKYLVRRESLREETLKQFRAVNTDSGSNFENELALEIAQTYCSRLKLTADIYYRTSTVNLTETIRASSWTYTFYSTFYGLDVNNFDHLSNLHSDKIINLTDCSSFKHQSKATDLCNLIKRCGPMHTVMLSIYLYGYIYIRDLKEFIKKSCFMNEYQVDECYNNLLQHCDSFIKDLTSSFKILRARLCDSSLFKIYKRHHDKCYTDVTKIARNRWMRRVRAKERPTVRFHLEIPLLRCVSRFRRKAEYVNLMLNISKTERHTLICMRVKQFLDCIEIFFEKINVISRRKVSCFKTSGKFQRYLARLAMSEALGGFYCQNTFQHATLEFFQDDDTSGIVPSVSFRMKIIFLLPCFVFVF